MATESGGSGISWTDDNPTQEVNQHAPNQKVSTQKSVSWADVLGRSVVSNVNKNILEVVLEKDSKGSFSVSDSDCAKFLLKLGLDMKTGRHVDGVQICPNGRGVMYITLKDQVDMANFYRYDVIDVTST